MAECDYYEWHIQGKATKAYSIGEVYKNLSENLVEVSWYKAIWNSGGIPKHSFLAWLFTLNRCPTRDRLLAWNIGTDSVCLLCNLAQESRDHMFFACNYSWSIWFPLASRCKQHALRNWNACLNQMQGLPFKNKKSMLTLLCWQASIYWLWGERNSRLHRQSFRSADSLLVFIERQVKERILSLRNTRPATSSAMMEIWHAHLPNNQPSTSMGD